MIENDSSRVRRNKSGEFWSTIQKVWHVSFDPTQIDFFRRLYFGPWGVLAPEFFLRRPTLKYRSIAVNSVINYSYLYYRYHGGREVLNNYNSNSNTTDPIWLDNIRCRGTERHIADCSHRPWGVHNCAHREDVVVRCFPRGMWTCTINIFLSNAGSSELHNYVIYWMQFDYSIMKSTWLSRQLWRNTLSLLVKPAILAA